MNTSTKKISARKIATIIVAFLFAPIFSNVAYASGNKNSASFSQTIRNEVPSIELRGIVTNEYGCAGEAIIMIYEEDGKSLHSTQLTNKMGKTKIMLPLNRRFTMVFSKPGYVSKRICIDTHIIGTPKDVYKFNYNIMLFQIIKGLDVSALNKPVAMVKYSNVSGKFDYDQAYTSFINEAIKKMYKEYYDLKKSNLELADINN